MYPHVRQLDTQVLAVAARNPDRRYVVRGTSAAVAYLRRAVTVSALRNVRFETRS